MKQAIIEQGIREPEISGPGIRESGSRQTRTNPAWVSQVINPLGKLRDKAGDKALQAFCATSALIATTPVLADLPAAGDVVPAGVNEDSPIELGTTLIRIAVQFMAVMIGAVVTLGVGAQVYKAFSEAKERNGWEDFFKTAAIGVFVIVAADALAILAFTYASAFTFVV